MGHTPVCTIVCVQGMWKRYRVNANMISNENCPFHYSTILVVQSTVYTLSIACITCNVDNVMYSIEMTGTLT